MPERVLGNSSLERIKSIHKLSRIYNRRFRISHEKQLLKLMKKHIEEIEQLSEQGKPHYLTETGDLIILCFEILLEKGISVDKTLFHCFERYEKKLSALMADKK